MTEQFMCSRYPERSTEFNGDPFFNRKFFFAGRIQQISPEKYFISLHFRQCTDRCRTASKQCGQEIPFNFYTKSRLFMMKFPALIENKFILFPAYNQYGALRRSRNHPVQFNGVCRTKPNSLQTGSSKYGS